MNPSPRRHCWSLAAAQSRSACLKGRPRLMSTSGNEEKPGEPFSVACPLHADGHPLGRNAVGQTTRVVDISCVILRDSDRVASCDCVMECGQNGEARYSLASPRAAAGIGPAIRAWLRRALSRTWPTRLSGVGRCAATPPVGERADHVQPAAAPGERAGVFQHRGPVGWSRRPRIGRRAVAGRAGSAIEAGFRRDRAARAARVGSSSSDTTVAMSSLRSAAAPPPRKVAIVKSRAARTGLASTPGVRVATRGRHAKPGVAGSGGQLPPAAAANRGNGCVVIAVRSTPP